MIFRQALLVRATRFLRPTRPVLEHRMATMHEPKPYLSHEERTAAAARDTTLHQVTLSRIEQDNTVKFLPGQWLDVHVPGLVKAGGFTITSTPAQAQLRSDEGPYLELAVQYAAKNPPAAYLWKPEKEILNSPLIVRVGGNFVWPPSGLPSTALHRVVLIAGGVGINPLISILTHLNNTGFPLRGVKLLYGTKSLSTDGSDILFLSRINDILKTGSPSFGDLTIELFVTSAGGNDEVFPDMKQPAGLSCFPRRMQKADLERALGQDLEGRRSTVCYICGPQAMTDELVDTVKGMQGMAPESVICEKWW